MSAPGTAPPGWYADPDGAPGTVRWWNGAGWSDVTTPAGPGVDVVGQRPRQAVQPTSWEPTPPSSRGRAPWIIAGAVLGVVVLVVVVFLAAGGRETTDPLPTTIAGPTVTGPTFAPGTIQIIDDEAGIAYPFLGDGWYEYALPAPLETTSVRGQYFVTQDSVPDGGEFIAQITSGPVAEGYGWAGTATLQTTAETLAESVRANYYPGPNDREVLRDEALTVDGAQAWVYEFVLSWDTAGYDASGERAALLLVDVGRAAPALLYLSIPNTHAELYGVVNRVIEATEVL